MLKVSGFYLEKQKVLFLKKYDLGHCQYQNKKALFTDPIFSDGFGFKIREFMWWASHRTSKQKKIVVNKSLIFKGQCSSF